jgi:hypothetical protein
VNALVDKCLEIQPPLLNERFIEHAAVGAERQLTHESLRRELREYNFGLSG